jgi:hypothetical protein
MRFTIRVLGIVGSLCAGVVLPQLDGQEAGSACSSDARQLGSHPCSIDIWPLPLHDPGPSEFEPPSPDPAIPVAPPPFERGVAMSCIDDTPPRLFVLAGLGSSTLDWGARVLRWLWRLAVHPLSGWATALLFFVALAREGAWGRGRRR